MFFTKIKIFDQTPHLKGALSGLRQFLTIESSLNKMKNYFTSEALFVLKIFKFLY